MLIKKNWDLLYSYDYQLQSPLHLATKRNNYELTQFLIQNKCDIDSRDCLGRTALFYAVRNQNPYIIRCLLFNRANPWSSYKNNFSKFIDQNSYSQACAQLIRVARKIHIGLLLAESKQRDQVWENLKSELNIQN